MHIQMLCELITGNDDNEEASNNVNTVGAGDQVRAVPRCLPAFQVAKGPVSVLEMPCVAAGLESQREDDMPVRGREDLR